MLSGYGLYELKLVKLFTNDVPESPKSLYFLHRVLRQHVAALISNIKTCIIYSYFCLLPVCLSKNWRQKTQRYR